jgi:hypothetical protein
MSIVLKHSMFSIHISYKYREAALNGKPVLAMLLSCIRGLGPFCWTSYEQYGDFRKDNFIQSKVFNSWWDCRELCAAGNCSFDGRHA